MIDKDEMNKRAAEKRYELDNDIRKFLKERDASTLDAIYCMGAVIALCDAYQMRPQQVYDALKESAPDWYKPMLSTIFDVGCGLIHLIGTKNFTQVKDD